jgi:hypothetical protein
LKNVVIFYENLVYFTALRYIISGPLVYFVVIWNIFPRLGMLHQEKYGNPDFLSRNSLIILKIDQTHVNIPMYNLIIAHQSRVARWYIFIPKPPNGYILEGFRIF